MMTKTQLKKFLNEVAEEIRVFERPHADNSQMMFDLLLDLLLNNKIELDPEPETNNIINNGKPLH